MAPPALLLEPQLDDEELAPWDRPDEGQLPEQPLPPVPAWLPDPWSHLPLAHRSAEAQLDDAYDRLDLLAVVESRLAAERAAALHDVRGLARAADRERGSTVHSDFAHLHVGSTLLLPQDEAEVELEQASHLRLRLPRTWAALRDGVVRPAQARVLVEQTAGLSPELCAQVEERLLRTISGRRVGSLRRAARKLVKTLRPQAEQERERRRALDERGVRGFAKDDGMGGVSASMPAGAQVLFLTALRQLAQRARTGDDARTQQQRMSDVLAAAPGLLLDMLDGRYGPAVAEALAAEGFRAGGRRAPVEALLLVPVGTALGTSDEAAELCGHGPVSAEHARALLRDATVRIATVDEHGRLLAVDDQAVDVRDAEQQHAPFTLTSETADGASDDGPRRRVREHLVQRLGPDAVDLLVGGRALDPDLDELPDPPPDEPQYRPSRRLARFLRRRDRHCVGPACSVPSHQCDLEHRIPWPHGPTSTVNLSPVSRTCHRAKQAGWRYERHPDGTASWFPPHSRRRYVERPDL